MGSTESLPKSKLPDTLVAVTVSAEPGPQTSSKQEDYVLLKKCIQDQRLRQTALDTMPDGCTAVHKAAEKRRCDLLELLLGRSDAKSPFVPPPELINCKKKGGATALHIAALRGYEDVVEVLLKHGADPLARNDNNEIPRDYCVCNHDYSKDPHGVLRERAKAKERISRMLQAVEAKAGTSR
eukprot:Sspe_Gene.15731::Locus_5489_Transcript_1_1_Confidence_1.000_Length_985::g.15731::m.15731